MFHYSQNIKYCPQTAVHFALKLWQLEYDSHTKEVLSTKHSPFLEAVAVNED